MEWELHSIALPFNLALAPRTMGDEHQSKQEHEGRRQPRRLGAAARAGFSCCAQRVTVTAQPWSALPMSPLRGSILQAHTAHSHTSPQSFRGTSKPFCTLKVNETETHKRWFKYCFGFRFLFALLFVLPPVLSLSFLMLPSYLSDISVLIFRVFSFSSWSFCQRNISSNCTLHRSEYVWNLVLRGLHLDSGHYPLTAYNS